MADHRTLSEGIERLKTEIVGFQNQIHQQILAAVSEAGCVIDTLGRVRHSNPAFRKQPDFDKLLCPQRPELRQMLRGLQKEVSEQHFPGVLKCQLRSLTSHAEYQLSAYPQYNQSGELDCFILVVGQKLYLKPPMHENLQSASSYLANPKTWN